MSEYLYSGRISSQTPVPHPRPAFFRTGISLCSCCSEARLAAQRFGHEHSVHTSNFLARVEDNCSGCGRCLVVCPVKMISLEAERADGSGRKQARIDESPCPGCGACARNCRISALTMQPRRPVRALRCRDEYLSLR